jgi:hypothetical protein
VQPMLFQTAWLVTHRVLPLWQPAQAIAPSPRDWPERSLWNSQAKPPGVRPDGTRHTPAPQPRRTSSHTPGTPATA